MNGTTPGPTLRIAVLGDFDGLHTQRYVRFFARRGHEVHAVSFYRPREGIGGVTLHVLSRTVAPSDAASSALSRGAVTRGASLAPPSLLRLVHALRYQRAGLRSVLRSIAPDVFHAHYVVEHGFYGALAGVHPFVVTAWGSDLLRESYTPLGRLIARWTLGQADLVTGNDPSLTRRAVHLGTKPENAIVVRVGIDRLFLEAHSVNADAADITPPTFISDRALEPLYNVETVVRAFASVRERLPESRLRVAGDGRQRPYLEKLARDLGLGESVRFLGRLAPADIRDALASAHVYVSVPDTDSMAVSNLEAMAAGCFPVLSNQPSVEGWVTDGVNGLLVPPSPSPRDLAEAMYAAATDADRRRRAVAPNRAHVEADGTHERNMLLLERHYYRLAGHPIANESGI